MPERPEVQYLVLADGTHPFLLARVRFPDVAQAISAGCPEWLDDVGLFDLPTDPSGVTVTLARAAEIALGWGAQIPGEGAAVVSRPALVRRMPANWSNLTPAEKRAWSLDVVTTPRRVDRIGWRARLGIAFGGSRRARRRPDIPVGSAAAVRADLEPQHWGPVTSSDTAAPEEIWAPETEPVPATSTIGPGSTANASTANGSTANGSTANGSTANGSTANGRTPNGSTAKGRRLPAVFSRMAEDSSPS